MWTGTDFVEARAILLLEEKGIKLRQDDYRMQEMLRFIIKSDLFLKK